MLLLLVVLVLLTSSSTSALDFPCVIGFKDLPAYQPIGIQCTLVLTGFDVADTTGNLPGWHGGNLGIIYKTDPNKPTVGMYLPDNTRIESFDIMSYHFGVGTVIENGPVTELTRGDLYLTGFDLTGEPKTTEDQGYKYSLRAGPLRFSTSLIRNVGSVKFECSRGSSSARSLGKRNETAVNPRYVCIFESIDLVLHMIPLRQEVGFDGSS